MVNMRSICLIVVCAFCTTSFGQKAVDVNSANLNPMSPQFFNVVAGEPVVMVKFTKLVDGTPYFKDEWLRGNVIVNGGTQYAGIYLKLDLFDNEVHFKDVRGTEMIATTPIQKIILIDSNEQKLYSFINGAFLISSGGG